jgi:2-phosphoglycerate kinase
MLGPIENALVVQCVLAISNEQVHASHFFVRDLSSQGLRPVEKYTTQLVEIRRIQEYIVERARRSDVPVVENVNVELAVGAVVELVLAAAERIEAVSA